MSRKRRRFSRAFRRSPARYETATLAVAVNVPSVDAPNDTARLRNKGSAHATAGQTDGGTRLLRISFRLPKHECYSRSERPP